MKLRVHIEMINTRQVDVEIEVMTPVSEVESLAILKVVEEFGEAEKYRLVHVEKADG